MRSAGTVHSFVFKSNSDHLAPIDFAGARGRQDRELERASRDARLRAKLGHEGRHFSVWDGVMVAAGEPRARRQRLLEMALPAGRVFSLAVSTDRAQSRTRSIRPRMRLADSGVFVQIGSRAFRIRPVSIAETGKSLIAWVAAGKTLLPRLVSLKVANHWSACLSFFQLARLASMYLSAHCLNVIALAASGFL